MPHSKTVLTLLILSSLLGAQPLTSQLPVPVSNCDTLVIRRNFDNLQELHSFIQQERKEYIESGRLYSSLALADLKWSESSAGAVEAKWRVSSVKFASVDSVVVVGLGHRNSKKFARILRFIKSAPASQMTVDKADRFLNGISLLKMESVPYYASYAKERIAMVVPLKEDFHNSFHGTLGSQPRNDGTRRLIGELRFHAENLMGTASAADLWWYRKDDRSQIFRLSYEEPFIWKFDFGINGSFSQILQDGLYVKRESAVSVTKPFSRSGKWYVGGENSIVTVSENGKALGMTDHSIKSVVLQNEQNRFDRRWNPSQGYSYSVRGQLGDYSSLGEEKGVLSRLKLEGEVVNQIKSKWRLALMGTASVVHLSSAPRLPLSEKLRFGGASSLRGYREQQFAADWMIMSQLELRYHTGTANNLYLFSDAGLFDSLNNRLLSAGFGINQLTPVGILRLEYALNRNDSPGKGKIHVRLQGDF